MIKTETYSSRAWLSEDTHSSGYVMCYYNPDCLNEEWKFFIRIADCSEVFYLLRNTRQKQTMINDINGMIAVIDKDRRAYTFRTGIRSIQFALKEFEYAPIKHLTVTEITKHLQRPKNIITLHQDIHTCSEEQWDEKIRILKTELIKFRTFLLSFK